MHPKLRQGRPPPSRSFQSASSAPSSKNRASELSWSIRSSQGRAPMLSMKSSRSLMYRGTLLIKWSNPSHLSSKIRRGRAPSGERNLMALSKRVTSSMALKRLKRKKHMLIWQQIKLRMPNLNLSINRIRQPLHLYSILTSRMMVMKMTYKDNSPQRKS